MKSIFQWTILFAIIGVFASCASEPKADKVVVEDKKAPAKAVAAASSFKVDVAASTVNFIGTKPTGQHQGIIKISSGGLNTKDGQIQSGKFSMDIGSLTVTDMDPENNGKLAGHLKSEDFFDVAKFPTSTFVITDVKAFDAKDYTSEVLTKGATHTISGNLTLKGETKNISFPAVVSISGNTMKAKANFNIERTDWGLSYGSDKSLGDRFIRPTVNIQLDIKANG